MKYQFAIFDFDGTLANSLPQMLKIFNGLADRYRIRPIPADEIGTLRTLDLHQLLNRLRIPWWKLPFILRQVRKQMASETGQVALFPGIAEVLIRSAGQGVRLAIVSSNSKSNIERILGSELSKLFEFAECSVSIFGKRPKLRKVLRQSGVGRAETIYIGDEVRDLNAARAEGIAFGAATWGYTPASIFRQHDPTELFESVAGLDEALSPVTPAPLGQS